MTTYMPAADLRAWRQLLGLSQADAALELGVSATQVSRWERGRAPIPRAIYLATRHLAAVAASTPRDGHAKPLRPLGYQIIVYGGDRDRNTGVYVETETEARAWASANGMAHRSVRLVTQGPAGDEVTFWHVV